jgi:prophage regulatory protein
MRFLSANEVSIMTSFSKTHLRRLALQGKFPMPIQLSEGRNGWLEEDVKAWIEQCIRSHTKKA